MARCKSIMDFADDFGDNSTTFHCGLEAEHPGFHMESGGLYGRKYIVVWEGDSLEDEDIEEVESTRIEGGKDGARARASDYRPASFKWTRGSSTSSVGGTADTSSSRWGQVSGSAPDSSTWWLATITGSGATTDQ